MMETQAEQASIRIAPDRRMPGMHGAAASCEGCASPPSARIEFEYAFQPIVDVDDRRIYAHEALVRGPNGEGAMSVMSQVNETNRYWFDQACRVKAIKTAARLGLDGCVSINFLPNAVYRPEVCIRSTLEAANANGFPLNRIIFEATEGERIQDGPWFASILREYQRYGFLTAIDDFGAGYAGLTLLADFTPDFIKLDMALVRDIDKSRSRQAIMKGLMHTCRDMGVTVIAEGIETSEERDFLYDAGVRLMQGYLFARPAFQAAGSINEKAWQSQA